MKTCTICQTPKENSEFNKKKRSSDGLQNKCRECSKKHAKKHYDENKEYYLAKNERKRQANLKRLDEFKAKQGCWKCRENDPVALDFHHLESETKENAVAAMVSGKASWGKIEKEVAKCVVLCASCHRKYHAGRFTLHCLVV